MEIKQKKGLSLRDAFPAVLTVALVAILMVALIYILSAISTIPANISYTTLNETISPTPTASVGNASQCGFGNLAVGIITNGTGGATIPSTNYSVSATGVVTNNSVVFKPDLQAWSISYTYTDKGSTCDAASSFTTQFANQVPLVGLILTIVLIAIVIGVLVSSFFAKRASRI